MSERISLLNFLRLLGVLLCVAMQPVAGQQVSSSKSASGGKAASTPALFEPGVITIAAATTYRPAFTPDGRTLYYTMEVGSDYVILVSRRKNNRWTQPEIASFSGQYSDAEPFLTPDGSKLFFASKRPIEGDKPKKDYDLWMVERAGDNRWSAPRHLEGTVNTDVHELYPAVTADGTLYFSRFGPGGIWRSRLVNGKYQEAEKLGAPVNADKKEAGVYVAPDGRYMIFEAKGADSLGGTDFYISFNRQGEWTQPRNLGAPVNSSAEETCAMLSPDGRFLFFTSNRKLPQTEVSINKGLTYTEMLTRLNSPGRGRWHIYYVDAASFGIK